MADQQKSNEEAVTKLKELEEKLAKADVNTLEKRDIEKDIAKFKHQELDSGQWARFYKIRSERRRLVDKLSYHEAFFAKREWPDPHEYSDYLVNIRLREVKMNWNARVPKLQDRLPSSSKAAKPAEPKKEE